MLKLAKYVWKAAAGCALAAQLSVSLADGDSLFDQGVSLFKAGEYAAAVQRFEQAWRQGLDSPVLHYNLASAYYKLEQYDLARRHFDRAAEAPALTSLSFYNLGLLAVRAGETESAAQWFRQSYERSDDPRLQQLAAAMLDKLGGQVPAQRRANPWSGRVGAGLGYDDNVSRINDDLDSVSGQDDIYLDVYGLVGYQLNGSRRQGNVVRFGGALARYGDLAFYNQTLINVGVYHYRPMGAWRTRIGGHYYYEWLDDGPFQQRIHARLRGDLPYHRSRQRLRLEYDYSRLDELDARYERLAGDRHRFKIENTTKRGKHTRVKLGYRLELNDREDFAAGTTFVSYSPTRHNFYAGVKHNFSSTWQGRLDVEYRYTRYEDNEVIGGSDMGRREDDRLRGTVRAVYRVAPSLEWELMYRHTRNESNFEEESYTVNQMTLSVSKSF